MNYDVRVQKIMDALPTMQENDVTKNIIIPLLQRLGYQKVEFYGGVAEHGKDILCWEIDKFEEVELTVAQVKHFKFTNTAADRNSLQTVLNQLVMCFKESLPYNDQLKHHPKEALLISTYVVDTKTLQSALGEHPHLSGQKIKIIDGLKLAQLALKHIPHLVKAFLGVELEIAGALAESLNNESLLAALHYFKKKDIKTFHTDIDFSLGKPSTELFFNGKFEPFNTTLKLHPEEWEILKAPVI